MKLKKIISTKLPKLVAVATLASASVTYASDADVLPSVNDEIEVFRNAAGWTVYKNITSQSCFISRSDEVNSAIQMGLTRDKEFGYVGAFVKDFEPEEGAKAIGVIVNGNLYVGESSPVTLEMSGGYKGGYVLVDNAQFVKDVEASTELIAFPDAPYTVTLNLKGAKTAIYEARQCMKEF